MCEDFPLAGSLKRRRNREDSAYISQRDSMSGGPPETPSPEIEEEDQNGYVLPGESPERGDSIVRYSITVCGPNNGNLLFKGIQYFNILGKYIRLLS